MLTFESDDKYSKCQMDKFTTFLDENIGTDYEVNESASGSTDEFYVVVFDLTPTEVEKITKYEMTLDGECVEEHKTKPLHGFGIHENHKEQPDGK